MRKFFLGIFICLLSIFLMSHNVSAAEIVNNSVSLYWTSPNLYYSCSAVQGSNYVLNSSSCHLGSRAEVRSISFYPQIAYQLGEGAYFAEVYLRIANNANTDNVVWYGADTGNNMQFVSEEEVSSTANGSVGYKTYRLLYRYTGPQLLNSTNFMSIGSNGGIFAGESFKVMNVIFWKVNSGDTAGVIQAINAQTQYLMDISQNLYIADGHLQDISDYLDFIKDNLPTASDIADEQEDRVQDSSDQAQQDANQAQQDAQQSTSSLLNVGSTIVSTIVNQPATDCVIDMDFAHYTVGNVNLCSNVPASILNLIRGLASLVIVPIIAMYALYLLNKLIGLLRGFTG